MKQVIRILWQSSTAIERCAAGTTISLRGVAGLTSQLHYKAFDFRNNRGLFKSALRAEREGYDAVAIGCFLDPVLDDLKEALDIPVLDVSGAMRKATESMVVLRRTSGLRVSRKGYYERPPAQEIEAVARGYGLELGPDDRIVASER
jgi:Asp/Glu/Hydantoin racemase